MDVDPTLGIGVTSHVGWKGQLDGENGEQILGRTEGLQNVEVRTGAVVMRAEKKRCWN